MGMKSKEVDKYINKFDIEKKKILEELRLCFASKVRYRGKKYC
jgi:hypothetical protein